MFITFFICQETQAQTFSWDISVYRYRTKEYILLSSQPIHCESGEYFEIIIKPDSDCYCYVVCTDNKQDIEPLFYEPIKGGNKVSIPDEFIQFEGNGTDTLYVIMSLERETTLESLIREFNRNKNSQNKNNLRREVLVLQNKFYKFGKAGSKPTSIGGDISRAIGEADYDATNFSNLNMYVIPITIQY
jgi:hypothetical protein